MKCGCNIDKGSLSTSRESVFSNKKEKGKWEE